MKYLISGKKGTFFVDKPYTNFDLIHDEGVFKYLKEGQEGKVKEVEIEKPTILKGYSFIPTVLSVRVDKGNGEFVEVIARYPFATASRTAKVVAEGVKTEEGIKYTKVYSEPVEASSIALGEGFTFKELKEIYEKIKEDDLSVLHERWKDKPFNPEELVEDLRKLFKEDRREFVYLTGRKDIKDENQIAIAKETLATKVSRAIFGALSGEKVEGVDVVPLNGMLVGIGGSQKVGYFPVVNMYPDRVKLTSTTYLGKSLIKNRDYTRLKVALNILNPRFIKALEENPALEELKEIKEDKIEKLEKLKAKIENEEFKKLLEYIERNIKYGDTESLKNNVNRLKRVVNDYFNEIMEQEEIIDYSNLFVKTKDGYIMRNQIHNVGIDEEYAKELLFGLPPRGQEKENVAVIMQAVPRLVKDKERGFITKLDMKPQAIVRVEDGEIERVNELKSDIYAKMFEEKIYRRLKFILNAKSFEQAKALLGDGFDKYKGLNELKSYFANKKIAIAYVEFVDYLQKQLSKANSLEEMKKIVERDPAIRSFKEKMELYEKNQKILQALLSTEKGNKYILDFIENIENTLNGDENLRKELKLVNYNLIDASLGQIQYKIDSKKLQKEIEKRKQKLEAKNIEIELIDFEDIVNSEIVKEAVEMREEEIAKEENEDMLYNFDIEAQARELEELEALDFDPFGPEL